ncbi:hypothetical protein D3C86_2019640 [compost metagenome]
MLVHEAGAASGRLTKGNEFSKAQVILSMRTHSFQTAIFDYTHGTWRVGADVGIVRVGGVDYLRTDRDSTERDNLGNLLWIDELR